MTEVEVKILEIDVAATEQKLRELGATKVFEGDIRASLFDFPDNRLDLVQSFVRIRTKGDTVELVVKKRIPSEISKSYEELEVVVSDYGVAQQILEHIGLVETVHGRKKHRISYTLENAHFEIDAFDDMPAFLEIEVTDSDHLAKWVELLGFRMEDAKPWSGRDVYEHYGVEYPRV
jgi:predicted adenylyl cyclase CyaB